jgi:hypothetical protein
LRIAASKPLGIISNRLNERPFFASRRIPLHRKTRYEVIYQWLRFEVRLGRRRRRPGTCKLKSGTEIMVSLVPVPFRRSCRVVGLRRVVANVVRRAGVVMHRRRSSPASVISAESYGLMQPVQSSYIERRRLDRDRRIGSSPGRSVCQRSLLVQSRRSGGRRHRSRTSETGL